MAGLLLLGIYGLTVYIAIRSIYRLCFHPLSKIPGPKLAAITGLYEFYFNVIKRGTFIWEMERLHGIYGRLSEADAVPPAQLIIRTYHTRYPS
jgi:hypothetical protein